MVSTPMVDEDARSAPQGAPREDGKFFECRCCKNTMPVDATEQFVAERSHAARTKRPSAHFLKFKEIDEQERVQDGSHWFGQR